MTFPDTTFTTGTTITSNWLNAVNDKCLETVSVKDFGAVGNGVTDDTAAIQAAISYATLNNKTVQFPTATYYTTAQIDVTCTLYCNNSTLYGYLRVFGDDITIQDLNLVSTNETYGIYLYGSVTVPTYYYRQKLENVKITFDTGVSSANSLGILASNIYYLTITDCNVLYGINLIGCANYTLTDSILDGDNYSNENELLHATLKSFGVVANNTFVNSYDNFIDLYTSGHRTVINGNRFINCKMRTGAAFELKVTLTDTTNTSSDANGWEEQIIFSDNMIFNCQASGAFFSTVLSIYYLDSRATPVFDWANTPRNFVISNNIFDTFDASNLGTSYGVGIGLNTINSAVVSNNVFRNYGYGTNSSYSTMSSAIWIEKCQDVIVEGNKLNFRNGVGVSLHDESTNITVANNHMTLDLKYGWELDYGIRITKEGTRPAPQITNSKFIGNTVVALLYGMRQLYVSGGSFTDCIIANNDFQQQSEIQTPTRCLFSGNNFQATAGKTAAIQIGSTNSISAYNTVVNNQVSTNSGSPCLGLSISKTRCSNVNGNTISTATYGLICYGSNTAGELDYLNIKDNFSVNQTQIAFPYYSGMAAGDTATLQASNNQKVT